MELDEYQKRARETRTVIHPITYPALGLAGEAGEVADQVKRIIRDDQCCLLPARKAKLQLELGDVLWYLAALADDLGLSLGELAQANLMKLAARKAAGKLKGEGSDR